MSRYDTEEGDDDDDRDVKIYVKVIEAADALAAVRRWFDKWDDTLDERAHRELSKLLDSTETEP